MSSHGEDAYLVLGVSRGASDEQIRTAYRRLMRRHHPDVTQAGDADAVVRINQAYAAIRDPVARERYTQSQKTPPPTPDGQTEVWDDDIIGDWGTEEDWDPGTPPAGPGHDPAGREGEQGEEAPRFDHFYTASAWTESLHHRQLRRLTIASTTAMTVCLAVLGIALVSDVVRHVSGTSDALASTVISYTLVGALLYGLVFTTTRKSVVTAGIILGLLALSGFLASSAFLPLLALFLPAILWGFFRRHKHAYQELVTGKQLWEEYCLSRKLQDKPALLTAALAQLAGTRHNYAILDGTVICIDRVAANTPYFSGKHWYHGINIQALTDPHGRLLWLSDGLPGSTHDTTTARHYGICEQAEQAGLRLLADSGYDKAAPGVITPYKNYRGRHQPKRPLIPAYKAANPALARLRGRGERGFATLGRKDKRKKRTLKNIPRWNRVFYRLSKCIKLSDLASGEHAPGVHGAVLAARLAGYSHVHLDGTLVCTDRGKAAGPTVVAGRPVDLWWSGKHHHHGGNVQVVTAPDGWPLWVSDVRHGSTQASHPAGGSRRVCADHRGGRQARREGPHQRLHARAQHGKKGGLMAGLINAVQKKVGLKKAADTKHDPADLSTSIETSGKVGEPAGRNTGAKDSTAADEPADEPAGDNAGTKDSGPAAEKTSDPANETTSRSTSIKVSAMAARKDGKKTSKKGLHGALASDAVVMPVATRPQTWDHGRNRLVL